MSVIDNRAISKFLLEGRDSSSIAIFRIFTGLVITFIYILLYPNWERYFGLYGVLQLSKPINFFFIDSVNLFYLTQHLFSPFYLWGVGLVAAIGFTLGIFARPCAIILWLLQISMVRRNGYAINGEDLVFRILLLWACFMPLDHKYSVRNIFFKTKSSNNKVRGMWAVRGAQIHFLMIYIFSVPMKWYRDEAWRNGDLMYYVFSSSTWSRYQISEYVAQFPFSEMLTYGALLFEFAIPILIWIERSRMFIVFSAIFFHLLISIFLMNITFFSLAMVCGYILFIPGEKVDLFLSKFKKRLEFCFPIRRA